MTGGEGPFPDLGPVVTDRLFDIATGNLDATSTELQSMLYVGDRVYADRRTGKIDWEGFPERWAARRRGRTDPREAPLSRLEAHLDIIERVLRGASMGEVTVTPVQLKAATWLYDLHRGARSVSSEEEGWMRLYDVIGELPDDDEREEEPG